MTSLSYITSHSDMQVSLTIISGSENGSLGLTKELDLAYGFIHKEILILSRGFAVIAT